MYIYIKYIHIKNSIYFLERSSSSSHEAASHDPALPWERVPARFPILPVPSRPSPGSVPSCPRDPLPGLGIWEPAAPAGCVEHTCLANYRVPALIARLRQWDHTTSPGML